MSPTKDKDGGEFQDIRYEDVPQAWKDHWKRLGIPEGEFPPPIDDSELFDRVRQAKEAALAEVEPTPGESKDDFIGRCMSDLADEFPDNKQRYAACNSMWERAQGSEG